MDFKRLLAYRNPYTGRSQVKLISRQLDVRQKPDKATQLPRVHSPNVAKENILLHYCTKLWCVIVEKENWWLSPPHVLLASQDFSYRQTSRPKRLLSFVYFECPSSASATIEQNQKLYFVKNNRNVHEFYVSLK